MTIPLKIRAHHLLCMQGFQGYGYSDDFTNHLHNIVVRIKANPDLLIQVIAECDAVCNGCPNCRESECRKEDGADLHVKNMDLEVLKFAGIKLNHVERASQLFTHMNKTFARTRAETRSQLATICGNCQWTKKCRWYLALQE